MTEGNETPPAPARRGFLASLGATAVGAAAAAAPLAAALVAFLDPLRRRPGEDGMVRVATLSVLPEGGAPRRFTVRADRVDAWTTHRDVPVGAVYLRRTSEGVVALNVVCPHAGCFVGLAPDGSGFRCPCHKSSFRLDGEIDDPGSPSPRAMDALEVEVRDGDEVWVRFQSFQPGREEKVPLA